MAKYNKAKDKQLRCGLRLPEYLLTKQKGKRVKEKREKEREREEKIVNIKILKKLF